MNPSAKVGISMRASVKYSFSRQHLRSARYFLWSAAALEFSGRTVDTDPDLPLQHQSYVTGCVISAAAALEASINELFLEAEDRNPYLGMDPNVMALLAEFWPQIERNPILHKFQVALLVARKTPFDKGAAPFQDAATLVKLRDALVHYKPEWDTNPNTHATLSERLKGKFAENELHSPASLWFPHRCLGAGCGLWVIYTAEAFMSEFCARLQIPARFD